MSRVVVPMTGSSVHSDAEGSAVVAAASRKVGGGPLEEPAYCLLDGMVDDPASSSSGSKVPFRLPITRLPASLGRTHIPLENPKHFFGLGKTVKALSRLQCQIDYRVPEGTIGPLCGVDQEEQKPHFTPNVPPPSVLHNPTNVDISSDPCKGYFYVTCLGKNPIKVNGQKVEQNEACILVNGSAVKISAFCLYFLIAEPDPSIPTKTLELPPLAGAAAAASNNNDTTNHNNQKAGKKRPHSETMSAAAPDVPASSSVSSSLPGTDAAKLSSAAATANKKSRGNAWTSIQEQLDAMTTEDLLSQLRAAVEKGIWDRRCQFVGATVAYRAVREAAQVPSIQQTAADGGVAKNEIVAWIHDESNPFREWADLMQEKLEPKSYQSSISKAMARAGYERINNKNFGRHVRWYLPADVHDNPNREKIYLESQKQQMEHKNDDSDNDDNPEEEKQDTDTGGSTRGGKVEANDEEEEGEENNEEEEDQGAEEEEDQGADQEDKEMEEEEEDEDGDDNPNQGEPGSGGDDDEEEESDEELTADNQNAEDSQGSSHS